MGVRALDGHRRLVITAGDAYKVLLLVGFVLLAIITLPNRIYDVEMSKLVFVLGVLGIWRYAWWMTHFVRSRVYAYKVFPGIREKSEALWASGWRPSRIHFMLTTFRERRDTTEKVLASIVRECRSVGVPARIALGTGDPYDEVIVAEYIRGAARNEDIEVILVRQNQPGKRCAIGLALRSLSRHLVMDNDPVVFMDGDTILEEGVLRKCLPLFALHPRLQALTTDEMPIVFGPKWMRSWLELRFCQRHMIMQSHALSRKVITLTGRMSVFRGKNVVEEGFIRTIEADYLDNWLWGRFRFLSGDDKSTWFWLLTRGAEMLYVPDALCYTVEYIVGSAGDRMKFNMWRWSGNMLRNGARAIALGPRQVGFFIWWCLVDQRIAMWTSLVGPFLALILTAFAGPVILQAYLIWIVATRLLLSLVLFQYAGRLDASFPFLLYLNQLLNAIVKVYAIFRLAKQRWTNRGNQSSELGSGRLAAFQLFMARYLTVFYIVVLFMFVAIYAGLMEAPSWTSLRLALGLG